MTAGIDIGAYLARSYGQPPCWELVADVYHRELGFALENYSASSCGVRNVAAAFRATLAAGGHGFMQRTEPEPWAVLLLSRRRSLGWHHAGVWVQGRVLHAASSGIGGVLWQDITTVRDTYPAIEFWARGRRRGDAA